MIKKQQDFFSGLFFCGIAVAVIYLASTYEIGTSRRMGPGYFPIMLSVLLLLLGVILVGRAFFGRFEALGWTTLRPAFFVLGATVIFGVLIKPLGLLGSLIILVLIGSRAYPGYGLLQALVLSILLSVGSALLFVYVLGQPVPVFGYWFT